MDNDFNLKVVLFLYAIAVCAIFFLAFRQSQRDSTNNKRFDECFATFKSEGMPREMYTEFMSNCFEK